MPLVQFTCEVLAPYSFGVRGDRGIIVRFAGKMKAEILVVQAVFTFRKRACALTRIRNSPVF